MARGDPHNDTRGAHDGSRCPLDGLNSPQDDNKRGRREGTRKSPESPLRQDGPTAPNMASRGRQE
eukprot:7777507-Pyramimonas_sp.AAC.1